MSFNSCDLSIHDWDNLSYQRFVEADGEVGIAIGKNGDDTIGHHTAVLAHAMQSYGINNVDQGCLQKVDPFKIDVQTFHGSWFDCEKGLLVNKGTATTKAGILTVDPYFVNMLDCSSRSSIVPELWHPGGFAYAFCDPPYGLRTERSETQRLYTSITSQLIPRQDVKIYNWHQKELLASVPELGAGAEWWGVFAFTIFVPTSSLIFGMVASTTD